MGVHRGEVVEKYVRISNITLTDLSDHLEKSLQTLYNYFEKERLSYDIIYKIGKRIGKDFSEEFPEMSGYYDTKNVENGPVEIDWKDKYIKLQDEYIKALKRKFDANEVMLEDILKKLTKLESSIVPK